MYSVHWLILYLLRSVCNFSWIIIDGMLLAVFTKKNVWLWNDYYLYAVHCLNFYLLWPLVLYLILCSWYVVAVLQEIITMCDCKMNIFFNSLHRLIHYLLRSILCSFIIWIVVACISFTVLNEDISLNNCKRIILLYPVHWLTLYLLFSVFFSYEFLQQVCYMPFYKEWFLFMI